MEVISNVPLYVVNGLYYAAIVFLVSIGLSFTFGLLNLLNMAHASFMGIGAFVAASLATVAFAQSSIAPFVIIVLVTPIIVGVIAVVFDRTIFRPLYEVDEEYQLLATFGLLLMLEDAMKVVWGTDPIRLSGPLESLGQVAFLGETYSLYYVFIIAMFVVTAIAPFVLFNRTQLGIIAQALSEEEEMVQALGINTNYVKLILLGVSAGLAGLGGALLVPVSAATTGMALDYVLLAFAVIVIGGLGSVRGAIVASLLIGLIRAFGIAFIPSLELALVFLLMALFITVKPEGLYGEEGVV